MERRTWIKQWDADHHSCDLHLVLSLSFFQQLSHRSWCTFHEFPFYRMNDDDFLDPIGKWRPKRRNNSSLSLSLSFTFPYSLFHDYLPSSFTNWLFALFNIYHLIIHSFLNRNRWLLTFNHNFRFISDLMSTNYSPSPNQDPGHIQWK